MTSWRPVEGDPAVDPAAGGAGAAHRASAGSGGSRHPRQTMLLAVAGGLLALAIVLAVVFVLLRGGSSGTGESGPDVAVDTFATGLTGKLSAALPSSACTDSKARLRAPVRKLRRAGASAARYETSTVRDTIAVGRIQVTLKRAGSAPVLVTVGMGEVDGSWCVQSLGLPPLSG